MIQSYCVAHINNSSTKNKGAALILAVLLFLFLSLAVVLGIVSPIVRYLAIADDYLKSKQSYYAAEAASEDAFYRVKNNISIVFPMYLSIDSAFSTTTLSITGSNEENILSEGNISSVIRKVSKDLSITDGYSFNFGVQTDLGGLRMNNNSNVIGNVYSNGPIKGDSNTKNLIYGDAVSAGASGSIDTVNITSSAYAHNITNAKINKDAHYQTIDSYSQSHTLGTLYQGSLDQSYGAMPISDDLISSWETTAASGGTLTTPCPYIINSSITIGPTKINCDLQISGNNTVVTLTGNVWVAGNITISNSVDIKVDNSIGDKSVGIISDNPSNRSSSSEINLQNSANFFGSVNALGIPNPDSYVMLVSQNNDSETKGAVNNNVAINLANNVVGNLLVYAAHGEIDLQNNAVLREVTSYQITLFNSAKVIYQLGLAQPIFTAGPGGQWKITRWNEAK